MAKLKSNTIVSHPETGEPKVLLAGEDKPDWATYKDSDGNTVNLLGDHLFEQTEDAEQEPTPDGLPPRSGKGSGVEAWQKYADDNGITYPEGAGRDEIIAAVEARQQ